MDTNVAQKIVPVEVKPGISLSTVTGALNVKDNVHSVQVKQTFTSAVINFMKCFLYIC